MLLFLTHTPFTLLMLSGKVNGFLIPCPIKYFIGFDCPGCGFQRAVFALLQGDFQESFLLYPPAIPFLISIIAGVSSYIFKWETESKLLKILYVATGIIMLVNYGYKIATHQLG